MKRPGVTVAARKGYYAVRDPGGVDQPVGSAGARRARAETGAERVSRARGLVPVSRTRSPRARAGGRRPQDGGTHVSPAADGKTYTSDFTILVRFLDERNQVVRKVSQHYEIDRARSARSIQREEGEVIFYREPELPPGVYTMETVAYDALRTSRASGSRRWKWPARTPALRMSSLVIVKRGEKVPEKDRRPTIRSS